MEVNRIIQGDCLEVLRILPTESIDCCITSPPYWGLRDYGMEEQLGLEKTPEEYVAKMVEVFGEVRRVLKKEGVMFLNLGDSYSAGSCGTSDKELEDYPNHDCLCENLCGECRKAYLIGKSRNESLPVAKQSALSSLPNLGHKGFETDHSPTLDSSRQVTHNEAANQDSKRCLNHEGEPLSSLLESMHDLSSRQPRGGLKQKDMLSVCLLCGRTSIPCVRECGHKTACTFGTVQTDHPLSHDKLDISSFCKAYPDYTTMHPNVKINLKPKDLAGIPWRTAFALQADGWYLRQDIIWHKPNPMPESVTDRCTKSHEYVFLLAKSQKYYFDNGAIKEEATGYDGRKDTTIKGSLKYKNGDYPHGGNANSLSVKGRERWQHKNLQEKGQQPNTFHKKRLVGEEYLSPVRNKRSVWTIPTHPYKEAHFATFPEALIEPMILAGCPKGGLVLDPFMGAGTTAVVAKKLGRNYLGIELNQEYVDIANKRIANTFINEEFDLEKSCPKNT